MTAPPPAWDEEAQRAGTHLLAELRSEIARADAKATILLGMLGMTAAVLSSLLTGRRWSPVELPALGALLWWTGASALALSLFALLLAVLPRSSSTPWRPGRPLTHFADVYSAVKASRLPTALIELGRDPAGSLFLALSETSRIAVRKHFWIKAGLVSFGCSMVLFPSSVITS
jgi:hypothetical protein